MKEKIPAPKAVSAHGNGHGKGPWTLAIDVGGTGIKASILDASGDMAAKRQRVATPSPCPPKALLAVLRGMVKELPHFDRISVGFPGVVREGRVLTAPNLGTPPWRDYQLTDALEKEFSKPARALNDAEVQGLGIIEGQGLEVVMTLGTGIGSAVFHNGKPMPHLELGQHPIHMRKTYDQYLGDAVRRKIGLKHWNRRVVKMLDIVTTLLNFDVLYLGGGNATRLNFKLPKTVHLASNDAGITGGVRLWDSAIWDAVPAKGPGAQNTRTVSTHKRV